MGTPVDLICKKAPTLKPKESKTTRLPKKPIIDFGSELRQTPLIIKPANGSKRNKPDVFVHICPL